MMFLNNIDQIKFTQISSELDRKDGSGKEKWLFEVKGKEYIFTGDVKFLPKQKERVIIVDFCPKQEEVNSNDWELTGTSKYSSNLVYAGVIELCCRRLPPVRKYRYVAMCGDFYRERLHTKLVKRLGSIASDSVVEETVKFLNDRLKFSVDMGVCHCIVGDLHGK